MDTSQITITQQLQQAARLVADCESSRIRLQQIQQQLQQYAEDRDEDTARIRHDSRLAMETEIHRLKTGAQSQIDTLIANTREQTEFRRRQTNQTLQELSKRLQDETGILEERRQSETWILQSILDESSDNSPVADFERESDIFINQKTDLDERQETLQQQVQHTAAFLERCHAATDTTLPAPNIANANRETLHVMAVEAADEVLVEANGLERLPLTQWVQGSRIWLCGLFGFLVLWIAMIPVRADLRQFLNPELSSPDWEWVGVSAVVALVSVVMVSLILLMRVQSQLRGRFQNMLQHRSNFAYAVSMWEKKSEKQIDRMEKTATQWRQEIEERRRQQTLKIQNEIDTRIQSLQSDIQTQSERLRHEQGRFEQQAQDDLATAMTQIDEKRQDDILNIERRFSEESDSALLLRQSQYQAATVKQRTAADQLLAVWKDLSSQLQKLGRNAHHLAFDNLNWPDQPDWRLPTTMPTSVSVGDIHITAAGPVESISATQSADVNVNMPAILRFPKDTSLLVEHDSAGRDAALSFLRRQMLKLLTVIPAGRVRLTLIDPVGLGQSFSAMMHLADFDELLIHSRIWTDSSQIRDQLQKVTEHMENIFQTYLRSQFDTIEDYNASAGEVAEPYHFVVVAGFPTAFTEESARHLSSILTSGPRCGVHALVAWNPTVGVPSGFDVDDLTNNCQRFQVTGNAVHPKQSLPTGVTFQAFPEPPSEQYVRLVRDIGEQSKDARRVEVSFTRIAPRDEDIWSHSSAAGIDLPIGRAGAARLQFMRLGRGTSQHVLIAGKTGSGKSTFLHILITNLALHYSPDEIQFYLIDFKKGVEFRTYAAHKLPHAKVVAIESDREFGLSVLERLDEILQERGELFRERGVQDVPSFRQNFPDVAMPRLLLLIDEFQEFFTAEDRVSSRASLLLDRLVRQGRAFGIHVLLGSQTLGGAYSLARSTMGQIAVRIALQCSDSDAHLILSEDNMAARLLARPGEAIYNDANGLVQGNHQFQVAWLDESRREEAIHTMLNHRSPDARRDYSMIVFEGNVPPTVERCGPLNAWLTSSGDATRRPVDTLAIWLGEPVAIAAPTRIELRRATGQNVLIVGQDETQVDSLLACSIVSTCGRIQARATEEQSGPRAELYFLHDGRDAESVQTFRTLKDTLQTESFQLTATDECDAMVEETFHEMVAREEDPGRSSGPERILVIRNIGQFRSLRKDEDDFGLGGFGEPKAATVASMFGDVLKRGPLVGIHVIVWADTFNNAIRWLSNSLMREFETRIAFRMNQTDSASLVDNPVAASLDQGRAIIYRDQTGTTEKFRPFAWPSAEWLQTLYGSVGSTPPAQETDRVPHTANDVQRDTRSESPAVQTEDVRQRPDNMPQDVNDDDKDPLDEQPFDINSLRIE
ncbi:MAG: FtsK/SpoIIIE domain-containing protein [Planctomycetaceae bacterium]